MRPLGKPGAAPAQIRGATVPARVPGCVHTDLMRAGLIPDPRIGTNELDLLWIGHFDLTTSLGVPGEFGHPRHAEAVERVFAAAASAGKHVGALATGVEDARELLRQGYRAVVYGDSLLFTDALTRAVSALRA